MERFGDGPDDGGRITLAQLEANPYPAYAELRDQGIVWVQAINRWMATSWEHVEQIERDTATFSARETDSLQTRIMGLTMMRTDGAAHRRLRGAGQAPFSPKAIQTHWGPLFERLADDLLDELATRDRAELVGDFCGPLAARALVALVGLRDVSDDAVRFWSEAMQAGTANYADDPEIWARCDRARREMAAATDAALERVRAQPDASVISAMAHAGEGEDPLSRDEILSNVMLTIGGGFNEPRDGMATAIWAMLTHPDQHALVRADPDTLWPRVTEEALRWISPLAMFMRQVAAPVEIGGARLEPGARIGLNVAAANRDAERFADPDAFDVTRPKTRNLAFGVGAHFCLGVWMTRNLMSVSGVPKLFARLDDLVLDLDEPPEIRGWVFRGHTRLHVRWG